MLSALAFQRANIYGSDFSIWQDTVKKSPLKSRPHNNLCLAYIEKKAPESAVKECSKALELNPKYVPSRSNLAHIYYQQGMFDDAENELKLAVAITERVRFPFEDLYRRLGFVYVKKGRLNHAVREFEKAIALIPDHPDAKRTITIHYTNEAWSYTDQGDFPRAILLHRIAVSLDPTYANAHYGLGQAYEATGQKEAAIRHWEEYLKLAPLDEPFRKDAMKHLERLR